MNAGRSHHGAHVRMTRHLHTHGYLALVLSGSYVEAGDRGRFRVEPGHVLVHRPFESHQDEFSRQGATVLNFALPEGFPEIDLGRVDDADLVARLAARDPDEAVQSLRATLHPLSVRLNDWPDSLAMALATEPGLNLANWADDIGIAPGSLSRGFKQAYGVSPKRFRHEQRTLQALRRLPDWTGSLAELAAETGFADQAHLTRSVVHMTGRPPSTIKG
jgi:AraC-like DNA-binding protein